VAAQERGGHRLAMRILHLDDDRLQLDLVRQWLEPAGHVVSSCARGNEALKAIERETFDMALLDWVVPDVSGEEVLRWIRSRNHSMPVIFATANGGEAEVAHILSIGADDYLVKPLRRLEFLARIGAAARRALPAEPEATIDVAPYALDVRRRRVSVAGRTVDMAPRLFDLALLLFRKRGELVSRAHIYEQVWGRREAPHTRTVDTHVSRLRGALELDGRHGWRLASVYQLGYRLEPA
jgi:two-component system, OmpR family, response regulator RegX3